MRFLLVLFLLASLARAQTKLLVTVVDRKSAEPVSGLQAENFTVLDDRTPKTVTAAEYGSALLDMMLLVDTSLVGEMVYPLAESFIAGLAEKEQMAVVSFASSADLIQDFTSSKQLLRQALRQVRFGNNPRVVDALFAAADGGFQDTVGRKVIVILSAGVEGFSRTSERDVQKLARSNQISIFPVYVIGAERSLFEKLARESGGAFFSARDLRLPPNKLAARVFSVLRGRYVLTLEGNQALGDHVKVEVTGGKPGARLWASGLPLD